MTKIRDVKSEIEHLEITMDEAIMIQVLKCLECSFAQFPCIPSHKAREEEKLPKLENLAQSLKDKELRRRNQDEATANYAKRFTKEKLRLTNAKPQEWEDSSNGKLTKCKFCEKEHQQNDCWNLQAKYHYCHETGQFAKFYKKKGATRTSSKNSVIYT